jgi:ABC-type antimicrobial peptide transport system permease subunit
LLLWLLWGLLLFPALGLAIPAAVVLIVLICATPLTFWVLLAYAFFEARADGVLRFLAWLLLAILSLPVLYAVPFLIAWYVPLPVHWAVTFFLLLRMQDLLLLATAGRVPLQYNVRNLLVRWRITILTALAFTLVIALMTVMLAFVNGMYALTAGSGQPGNVMVLADGATDELFSNLGYDDSSDVAEQPQVLRDNHDRPLCSMETYLVVSQVIPGAPKGGKQRRFVQVRGVDDPAMSGRVHGLPLHPGGAWFSPAGVSTRKNADGSESGEPVIQAVLGEGIAREMGHDLGRPTLLPGDYFDLGPRTWVVTGVLQSAGSTFDSEVWAKRNIVGPLFGKTNYTTIVLRTAGPEKAGELADYLTKGFKKAALNAQVETAYYEKLNATNQQFLYAIIFVAAVMAVGGIFGVMNTMFAAISQRTKDIGVLRILGFARWQILVSFLLESLVIALIGGLLGCALGYLCNGWSASSIVGGGGGGGKSVMLKLVVDWNILAAGLLFTLIMGGLGGLFPALSAMRLKPLESLR